MHAEASTIVNVCSGLCAGMVCMHTFVCACIHECDCGFVGACTCNSLLVCSRLHMCVCVCVCGRAGVFVKVLSACV